MFVEWKRGTNVVRLLNSVADNFLFGQRRRKCLINYARWIFIRGEKRFICLEVSMRSMFFSDWMKRCSIVEEDEDPNSSFWLFVESFEEVMEENNSSRIDVDGGILHSFSARQRSLLYSRMDIVVLTLVSFENIWERHRRIRDEKDEREDWMIEEWVFHPNEDTDRHWKNTFVVNLLNVRRDKGPLKYYVIKSRGGRGQWKLTIDYSGGGRGTAEDDAIVKKCSWLQRNESRKRVIG